MKIFFPKKWLTRKRILLTVLFASLFILGSAVTWFKYQNNILEKKYAEQSQTTLNQDKFDDLFLNIQRGRSAVRGFAATKNENFIKNFNRIIDTIAVHHNDLKILQDRSGSALTQSLYTEFDRLINEMIGFMQQIKDLSGEGHFDSAMAIIATEKGVQLNDSILAMKDKTNISFRESQQISQAIFTALNKKNNNLSYLGIILAMILISIVSFLLVKEIKIANDISEELNKQKDFMKVTLTSLGEGLISTHKDGSIRYMNPVAEKMTGWKNEEAKNKPLHTVYHIHNEETGLPFENIVSRIIREGKHVELENNTILQSRNNDQFVISNNGSPLLDKNGNILGAVLVFNDITERKKTEDELKVSEKLFRNMIENLSEAVYTCDELGYIKVYNKAAVKLWGRVPLVGKDLWSGCWKMLNADGKELDPGNSPMAVCIKEKRAIFGKEILIERQDGTTRHVLPSPAPLFNAAGQLTGAVNMLFDITDKKEREVLIKKTEEKYRDLFDQASDAIMIYSFDGVIHEFNDLIWQISGYTKEAFSTLKMEDILHGEMIMNAEMYNAILEGRSVILNRQFKCKDGGLIDMEVKTKMLPDGKILGFGRDVTERKRDEEIVRKVNERYEILAKATSDTIWDWDMINNRMLYNEGNKLMFGYENTEVENVHEWWRKNIHPADLDYIVSALDEVYKQKQHLIQLEYRFRCADGTYKYIMDRGFVIYDESGKPVRMIGAMQDISKEKEHEKQIAVAIIETQEKERRELGMELHDNVNQLLSATLLYLGMASRSSQAGADVSETLDECIRYITEAINDIRNLSHRLTPYTKENVSLKEVLEWLTEPIQKSEKCTIDLQVDEFSRSVVASDIQTNLYRIIQAQLTNIVKHAEASNIRIKVQLADDLVRLIINDNGKGFDPETVKEGIGLQNIKRRAELFSGSYTITSSPGNGCEIKVEIPIA